MSQPVARSRPTSAALARLGGADPRVLARSGERCRQQFVQMGLVLLATASIAAISMTFALTDGLDVHPAAALLGGIAWGLVILVIDRILILTLERGQGFRRTAAIVAPRILIAALLGVVISTPLVLRVFHDEIQAQIIKTNLQEQAGLGAAVDNTANANELERVRAEIARQEAVLRGEAEAVRTPEVQARETYLAEANTTLDQRREESNRKYAKWQCELYGAGCEGATTNPGPGPLADALEREYNTALGVTNAAERAVRDAQADLDLAREAAAGQNAEAVRVAQEEANRVLPGLRDRLTQLEAGYNSNLDTGTDRVQSNDGILAQIIALNDLSEADTEALLTHLAVGLLFFMIELMPVLVKVLTFLGGESMYDKVRAKDDEQIEKIAESLRTRENSQRDAEDQRAQADAQNRQAVEADARHREHGMGIKTNAHVEAEMTKILDVVLAQWSASVQAMLQNPTPPSPPAAQNGAAPTGVPQHNGTAYSGVGAGPALLQRFTGWLSRPPQSAPVPTPPTGQPTAQPGFPPPQQRSTPPPAQPVTQPIPTTPPPGPGGTSQTVVRTAFNLPNGGRL